MVNAALYISYNVGVRSGLRLAASPPAWKRWISSFDRFRLLSGPIIATPTLRTGYTYSP